MSRERGFTIVEVVVAVLVLAIGMLGLATTSALVTRMIARGQRSAVSLAFGTQRVERLRTKGCSNQTAGADTLRRGSSIAATNAWAFANLGGSTWRITVATRHLTAQNRWRTDTLQTELLCVI